MVQTSWTRLTGGMVESVELDGSSGPCFSFEWATNEEIAPWFVLKINVPSFKPELISLERIKSQIWNFETPSWFWAMPVQFGCLKLRFSTEIHRAFILFLDLFFLLKLDAVPCCCQPGHGSKPPGVAHGWSGENAWILPSTGLELWETSAREGATTLCLWVRLGLNRWPKSNQFFWASWKIEVGKRNLAIAPAAFNGFNMF